MWQLREVKKQQCRKGTWKEKVLYEDDDINKVKLFAQINLGCDNWISGLEGDTTLYHDVDIANKTEGCFCHIYQIEQMV